MLSARVAQVLDIDNALYAVTRQHVFSRPQNVREAHI